MVDNGSIDNTLDVAKEYVGKFPQLIKYVVEDKIQSSYAARNKGIKAAKGNLICFIDSDMTVKNNYLTNVSDYFDNNRIDYLEMLDVNKLIKPFIKKNNYKIFIAYYLGKTRLIDNI